MNVNYVKLDHEPKRTFSKDRRKYVFFIWDLPLILVTISICRKANWIGYSLRRNRLLKHFIEGKIERRTEATGRHGKRRKQLPDDLKETRVLQI